MEPWFCPHNRHKKKDVNEIMSLTPQQTQIQGVNGTMDLITSTGSKSDHGFDPTTDTSTGRKWDECDLC